MINVDGIADELKQLRQWVLTEKETKEPYPLAGDRTRRASCNDIKDWNTFENAVKCLNDRFVGIAFAIKEPYAIIDLDAQYINDNLSEMARDIIDRLDSYTEKSMSGNGIHIIVKTDNNDIYIPQKPIELYSRSKFMTLTGDIFEGKNIIQKRQAELEAIIKDYVLTKKTNPKQPSNISHEDQEITDKLKNSISIREVVDRLGGLGLDNTLHGECPTGHESSGGKCFSINAKENYFYCFHCGEGGDIIRLVETVQGYNFIEAITWLGEQFNIPIPAYKQSKEGDTVATEPEQTKDSKKDDPKRFFNENSFIPGKLADELKHEHNFICSTGMLYIYIDGYFKAISDDYVESLCYQKLGHYARTNRVSEVVKYIRGNSRTEPDRLNIHKYLINLENGMYDYQKGKMLDHSIDYLSTTRIPVKYDQSVGYGLVNEWLESTLVDADCIQLACELFGYCLIPDTTMAKAFMLVGAGANGKSTFLTVLENFIGQDNVSNVPLQELSDNRFKRADIHGKLVNLFADLDNRALESTTYFKTIVAGDSIDAERKNQNPFSFRPFARLVFSANEIPRSRDKSFAYYRRWCIIPFERQFMGADDKKGLDEELSRPENLSALLNCALPELKRMIDRKSFSEPEKVKEALNEYEKQNDPVKAFIDECCEFDSESKVERKKLYDTFCRYCDEAGFKVATNRSFYQRLRIFREITESQEHSGERGFTGIKLKTD